MRELRFLRDELAARYGHPLQRIPVDLGLSCPNRRPDGRGGCAFCDAGGSRAQHLAAGLPLSEQVAAGIRYAQERYSSKPPYIVYFQAFTGTNAPAAALRARYEEVLALADFPVMIVATRPDCLPDNTIALLSELNRTREVWIELGVQTANDDTLSKIGRGHDFACTSDAVTRLHAAGLRTAAHLILGLPGEGREEHLDTARRIAALPFDAVKIHNLLVLKGTPLAKWHAEGRCPALNEYEYAAELAAVLRVLPDSMRLMRLSAEAPADRVIAPKWWMKKSQFLDFFKRQFLAESDPAAAAANGPSRFQPCRTGDGSYTLYHPGYRQHFHSVAGAQEESFHKYLGPVRFSDRLEHTHDTVRLLDIGFGLGFNATAAVHLAESIGRAKLRITSLEADPQVLSAALALPEHAGRELIHQLSEHDGTYDSASASLKIVWGDARATLAADGETYDFIFLDAFSPDSNPELWTLDFVRRLYARLSPDGLLATYASAYPFLGALLQTGFHVARSLPFGRRQGGIVAAKGELPPDLTPLTGKDRGIAMESTAGLPYRDPMLTLDRDTIRAERRDRVAAARAAGMPKWYHDR